MSLSPRTPSRVGDILYYEFIEPRRIKLNRLALLLGVHRNTLASLINGSTRLTPLMAVKLAAAFGTSAEFWLNIQMRVDLSVLEKDYAVSEQLSNIRGTRKYLIGQ